MYCLQSEQIRDAFYFTVVINSVREITEFYFRSTLGVEPKFYVCNCNDARTKVVPLPIWHIQDTFVPLSIWHIQVVPLSLSSFIYEIFVCILIEVHLISHF